MVLLSSTTTPWPTGLRSRPPGRVRPDPTIVGVGGPRPALAQPAPRWLTPGSSTGTAARPPRRCRRWLGHAAALRDNLSVHRTTLDEVEASTPASAGGAAAWCRRGGRPVLPHLDHGGTVTYGPAALVLHGVTPTACLAGRYSGGGGAGRATPAGGGPRRRAAGARWLTCAGRGGRRGQGPRRGAHGRRQRRLRGGVLDDLAGVPVALAAAVELVWLQAQDELGGEGPGAAWPV